MYYTCENLAIPNSVDECLKVGALYYLDFDIELRILDDNNRHDIVQVPPTRCRIWSFWRRSLTTCC